MERLSLNPISIYTSTVALRWSVCSKDHFASCSFDDKCTNLNVCLSCCLQYRIRPMCEIGYQLVHLHAVSGSNLQTLSSYHNERLYTVLPFFAVWFLFKLDINNGKKVAFPYFFTF